MRLALRRMEGLRHVRVARVGCRDHAIPRVPQCSGLLAAAASCSASSWARAWASMPSVVPVIAQAQLASARDQLLRAAELPARQQPQQARGRAGPAGFLRTAMCTKPPPWFGQRCRSASSAASIPAWSRSRSASARDTSAEP
jgi:hypothetical protein